MDIEKLNAELEKALMNNTSYHSEMDQNRNFYLYSAFYPSKTGQKRQTTDLSNNLLRVYADKNIHFTSAFPTIKVPTTGATPEERKAASIREKIILGVWRKSRGAILQKKWSFDGTVFSAAVAETGFDLEARCAFVRRYDPRYCFWQVSNGNDSRVVAFWAVYPITKDEAQERFGVIPKSQPISTTALTDKYLKSIDGKDWYLMAIRWDEKTRAAWIGDSWVEEPHNHMMGHIPIDICTPFEDASDAGKGAFYLAPMVNPQANLNLTLQRRDNIVARMAHPVVWGRGVISRQLDDIKQGMKNGGFVGLKQGGELGLLQLNDVKLLNEHAEDIRADMQRLSGFSAAAMGELAGANTSGDALGMYFTPTQRHIENQNISWVAFYESINAKILKLYEKFGKVEEQFSLDGFSTRGTLLPMADEPDKLQYQSGGYSITFDKTVIAGKYNSTVLMNSITPKNELEEKRMVIEAVQQNFISRTTAYEMFGIESPEDEFDLLESEQQNPAINPKGAEQMLNVAQGLQQPPATSPSPAAGAPQPVAQEIQPNV